MTALLQTDDFCTFEYLQRRDKNTKAEFKTGIPTIEVLLVIRVECCRIIVYMDRIFSKMYLVMLNISLNRLNLCFRIVMGNIVYKIVPMQTTCILLFCDLQDNLATSPNTNDDDPK